jgi:hypothetical protein
MPGNKANTRKIIELLSLYNYQNKVPFNCLCIENKYDKLVIGSDSPSTRLPNNVRVAQIVNYSKGGRSEFGNFYLGQPLNLNYLGRMEGMPGGSGKPPTNF